MLGGDDGEAVERQHRAIAQMEEAERRSERPIAACIRQQHAESLRLVAVLAVLLQAARDTVVDRLAGNVSTEAIESTPKAAASQNTAAKPNPQPSKPDRPAPTILPAWLNAWLRPFCRLKPAWPDHAEGDAGDRGADGRAGDRGRHLRARDEPEFCDSRISRRRQNRTDAGHDHVEALARGGVHQRAGGRGHRHSGDAAERHHRPIATALPAMREQEDPEKRADAGLHVRHEEIQRVKREQAPLFHLFAADARRSHGNSKAETSLIRFPAVEVTRAPLGSPLN